MSEQRRGQRKKQADAAKAGCQSNAEASEQSRPTPQRLPPRLPTHLACGGDPELLVRKLGHGNLRRVAAIGVRLVGRQMGAEEGVERLAVGLHVAVVPGRLVDHEVLRRTQRVKGP